MVTERSTKLGNISFGEGLFALAFLISIAAGAYWAISSAGPLKTEYSVSQFLPPEHPLLKADAETRKQFFLDQTQPVLLTLDLAKDAKGDWLETGRLERLAQVGEAFKAIEGVTGGINLGTVQGASKAGDELVVGNLLKITSDATRRERVKKDRFLTPMLVSEDMRRTLLVVSIDEKLTVEGIRGVVEKVREVTVKTLPEAKVSVGGVPAIQTRLSMMVKSELVRFMGLALVASCLTLLLVFSTKWTVLVPFFAILMSNVFIMAFMAWAGLSMTVLAVTIPILVSVIVLSLCIHSMLRFVEDAAKEERPTSRLTPKAAQVFATMRSLFTPNLLTSLTTCCGFATLMLTNVPVVKEFGAAVSASVMISWLATSLVLFPLMLLLPVPVSRVWVFKEASWVDNIFKFRREITVVVAVFCVALALIGRNLHWSARLFDDLPKNEEARRATEDIDRKLGGTIPMELVIAYEKTSEPWNDPMNMSELDVLMRTLRERPEVGSAVGLPDLLRQAMGDPTAQLPAERKTIAESLFLISMSEDGMLKKFLTSDGLSTRVSLRMRDEPSDKLEKVMAAIVSDAKIVFPKAKITSAGMATTVHKLNNSLSLSLLGGFWEALAAITVLLYCVFRSWRWTLAAILPNLVPAAILLGILAIMKTPIKPGVAIVFSIALGIAFINSVYLLQRLRSLLKESGLGIKFEIETALRHEGNPCVITSVCVLAGFATFLLSQFDINKTFGAYMLMSLVFGMVADLAFMPALIRLWPWILETETDNIMEQDMTIELEDKSFLPRAAAAIAALIVALLPTGAARAAAQDANKILKSVEQRLDAKDEAARIKMKVVESNGASKERELVIKRKSGAKHQVLVRLKSPSDVSGVALLSVSKGGSEDQWIYMPSQKKARRVVAGNKSQRFLDTEFSLEDFSANTYARFENKIYKEERSPSAAVTVIESKAKTSGDTSYSRILTWVDVSSYQVQKSEYYDNSGKLLKTIVFRDYKKYGNAWRAQTVEVRNAQTQRSTVLKIAALKLNAGLSDREFTQTALEEAD